ncbi:MAG: hypothetical protein ACFFDN_50700 [Candidatus Hodarchaeota archaeon]
MECSKKIINIIIKKENVFTTNFDLLLVDYINPKHLHGKFNIPLNDLKDFILSKDENGKLEFKYLYGTNGLEKLLRINAIRNIVQNEYDFDFFFNEDLIFDNLLIYGIAFGKNEYISDEFLNQYPEHKNSKLVKTVDGHILILLSKMISESRLNNITITYYSEDDKLNYLDLFNSNEFHGRIYYKHCSEVINF